VVFVSKISGFYGIKIKMYFNETKHLGRPHFHARHGGHEATIDIDSLQILAGSLPPTAIRLVVEWAGAHEAELLEDWRLAREHKPLLPIEPLS
jgi:hypothetical protein